MSLPEKVRLGDLLLQQKLITEEQLTIALDQQKRNKLRLGRILFNNGFVSEENISRTLARQFDLPYFELRDFPIKPEIVRIMPESLARQFHAIILEIRKDRLLVGMVDPTDQDAISGIEEIVNSGIDVAVVTEGQFLAALDRGYWRTQEITGQK